MATANNFGVLRGSTRQRRFSALVTVGLMVLGLGSSPSTSAGDHGGSDAESDAGIKHACERLILDYASLRDQRRGADFANLFTADGVLEVNGETFVGRNALKARFAETPRQRTRHMMSNIRVTVQGAERASAVSYALIFVGEQSSAADSGPVAVPGFTAMGEYHDEFVLTDTGWRIAARRFIPAFVPK